MGTFKILALHIYDKCRKDFLKNLQTNYTYYFISGYKYNFETEWLDTVESYHQLSSNFFSTKEAKNTILNFSAIVGKNGCGKSSLLEIVLRVLNNFSYYAGYKKHHKSLTVVNGLYCKLFFEVGERIYAIESEGSYVVLQNDKEKKQLSDASKTAFIYRSNEFIGFDFPLFNTIFYNNSLYAFRASDYEHECDDLDGNWLVPLIEKSDKYQVPINIAPYREDGSIDIGLETSLNHQRMIDFFTHVWHNKEIPDSQYMPYGVAYRLSVDEKLVRKVLTYSREIDVPKDLMRFWENFLSNYRQYETFYKACYSLSGIKKAQDAFFKQTATIMHENKQISKLDKGIIQKFSNLPVALHRRIALIVAVYEFWMSSGLILDTTDFQLCTPLFKSAPSNRYRCLLYLIYKTINLVDRYSSRFNFCISHWTNDYGVPLQHALKTISNDLLYQKGSVLTLKLRQSLNYINFGADLSFDSYTSDAVEGYSHFISFGDLLSKVEVCYKKYGGNNTIPKHKRPRTVAQQRISFLLPPIFETEIIVSSGDDLFPLNRMSSGQRQLLNLVSTLSYHLKNIDDIPVAKEWVNYNNVNIVLDEIDLYFHPEYQRKIVKYLVDIFGKQSFKFIETINFILVTHSPFILSDIPKQNVMFLNEGKQDYSMQENTFGANIHTLLKNGFFLNGMPIGDFAKEKINDLFAQLNGSNEITSDELDAIEREALLVSEPLLRKQLLSMIAMRRPLCHSKELELLKKRVAELEARLND